MRILHVGKYFHPSHGGIESFLYDLASASARLGTEQGLIVHARHGENPGGLDQDRYPFLRYFDRVKAWGTLGYAPVSPSFGQRLHRAIRGFNPDVLHLHMPNPSAFWALALPAARRIPWVIHWHADAAAPEFERVVRLLYPLYRPFEQALLARARQVIVTSPPYLQGSQALTRWHGKCRVVPLGLNTERLSSRDASAVSPDWDSGKSLRLLAVGRLTPYKGLEVLVRAMAHTRAQMAIVGEGAERAGLERLIDELKLDQQVHLIGGASDAVRNGLLNQCDLVCLPSLNRAEAFGISVLEAMAMGKPALVSKLPGSGLPWLVEDGRTGWHVRPDDATALSERINWLDKHREEIAASGRRAAARYRDHFDIDRVSEQIIELQQHILGASQHQNA